MQGDRGIQIKKRGWILKKPFGMIKVICNELGPESCISWSWIGAICYDHARTLVTILHASDIHGKCAIIARWSCMIMTECEIISIHKYIPLKIYHQHCNPPFYIYNPHLLYLPPTHTDSSSTMYSNIPRIHCSFRSIQPAFTTHKMHLLTTQCSGCEYSIRDIAFGC